MVLIEILLEEHQGLLEGQPEEEDMEMGVPLQRMSTEMPTHLPTPPPPPSQSPTSPPPPPPSQLPKPEEEEEEGEGKEKRESDVVVEVSKEKVGPEDIEAKDNGNVETNEKLEKEENTK